MIRSLFDDAVNIGDVRSNDAFLELSICDDLAKLR